MLTHYKYDVIIMIRFCVKYQLWLGVIVMDDLINRIKSDSLEMLEYFDSFCREHEINYCIAFGTEIGAIRHKGFIPWDDDIDVDMHYKDYKKFVKAWKRYGDKGKYFLQNKKTDKYINTLFPRIRKNMSAWIDPGCENIPIHWGLPIDIFLVFDLPRSRIMQSIQSKLYGLGTRYCGYAWNHPDSGYFKKLLYQNLTLILYRGVSILSVFSAGSNMVFYPFGYPSKNFISKSVFYPVKNIKFDRLNLLCHADSHKYLEWQYGDYMTLPSEESRKGHPVGIIDLDNEYSKYTGIRVH